MQAKKSVSLLLAVCLLSSFFGFIDISKYKPERNEILLTFEFPTPVVTKGSSADSVTVSGLSQDGAPGEPVLPSKMVRALLPLGKDVQSIEVSTGNREVLAGEFHVGCGKTPLPIPPNDSGTDSAVDEPDATIYNSANPFPGKFFSDVMVQCLRGYKMVLLNLNPVQYIPSTGELSYFESMTVTITLEETGELSPMFRNLPQDRDLIAGVVDNPGEVETYSQTLTFPPHTSLVDPSRSYDYVVITNSTLKSAFQPLVDWKISKGLNATIVTVQDIMKEPAYDGDGAFGDGSALPQFNDTQAHVRNFIKDAYLNWGTEYVLLGGDAPIIPQRNAYCYYGSYTETDIPCDAYYGGLDGSWDADHDGTFGETVYRIAAPENGTAGEEADFALEVFVGRAPANDPAQAARFVQKTLAHEQEDPNADYLGNALLIGQSLDTVTQGGNGVDRAADAIPQYSLTRLYARDQTYSATSVTTELNSNKYQMVIHNGHSNYQTVMGLSRSQASALTSTKYFMVYSIGCDSADFVKDSVAERFITSPTGGAFAYIGNSRYGIYAEASTDGPADRYERLFCSMVGSGVTNLGKALAFAKMLEPINDRWTFFCLTLLGDPETELVTAIRTPTSHFETRTDLLASSRIGGLVTLRGTAKRGTAEGATFSYYQIDFGVGTAPTSWSSTGMTLANNGQSEVVNGTLATWNTTQVAQNTFTIRLRVFDEQGLVGEDRWIVVVRLDALPIYIRADGSVDPSTAPIQRNGDVYTLTGNIAVTEGDVIVIERDDMTLDGAGYVVQGTGRYGEGIGLVGRSNVTIKNIVVTGCLYAIYLQQSSRNTISGSKTQGNTHGIFLVESSNNTIIGNNVTSNYYGIALTSLSDNNIVVGNWIANNRGQEIGMGAVYYYKSSNNTFDYNVFMNNTQHVFDADWGCPDMGLINPSINIWDDGYPSGGNYWSDYAGTDLYRGSHQNETCSDGIGDTPYTIDSNNRDNYPLMKPYPWGPHDIGVTYVGTVLEIYSPPIILIFPPKTIIGLGFTWHISVFAMNYGANPEVFNVTVYANTTAIGTITNVALASRDSIILNITWDTIGFARGNYTINAYATSVPGETDIMDNNLTIGWITVTIPGDVTGNVWVDMLDVSILIDKFMATPGDPRWELNCDVNDDLDNDMADISLAIDHFMQT